jgi:hypothetical protein
MTRVGEEFPLDCPTCGGNIRLIAFITDPGPIRKILTHLGEPLDVPPIGCRETPHQPHQLHQPPIRSKMAADVLAEVPLAGLSFTFCTLVNAMSLMPARRGHRRRR